MHDTMDLFNHVKLLIGYPNSYLMMVDGEREREEDRHEGTKNKK